MGYGFSRGHFAARPGEAPEGARICTFGLIDKTESSVLSSVFLERRDASLISAVVFEDCGKWRMNTYGEVTVFL